MKIVDNLEKQSIPTVNQHHSQDHVNQYHHFQSFAKIHPPPAAAPSQPKLILTPSSLNQPYLSLGATD